MAVTKLLPKKERLDILINYVMNGEKTEEMYLVSGINCLPETAIKEMNETKEKFGKKNGNIAYHLIQSFDGNEVSKEHIANLLKEEEITKLENCPCYMY